MHKQGVAIAVGVDKIKTRKGLHAQCIAPLFEVVGLAHSQPLLDLPYFAHARITHRVSAVIGAQYRPVHRAQPLFGHRPRNKTGEFDVDGDIARFQRSPLAIEAIAHWVVGVDIQYVDID